jgi:hypothetical protein
MKQILSIDGQKILVIDKDLCPVKLGTDDGELIPVTEYLEIIIKSNINYDYPDLRHAWETAPLYMDERTKEIFINSLECIRELTNYSIAEIANLIGMTFKEYHYITKEKI